jgi:hypothetical protein
MNLHTTQVWAWLDDRETLDLGELAQATHLSESELQELQGYGPLQARPGSSGHFSAGWVGPLRQAARLRADFDLDLMALALLLDQLVRVEALERELCALRARLPDSREAGA